MDNPTILRVTSDIRQQWYEKLEREVKVLTAEKLSIYNSAMELYYEQSNTSSATNVVMRADGSAILLGGGRGEIMLP